MTGAGSQIGIVDAVDEAAAVAWLRRAVQTPSITGDEMAFAVLAAALVIAPWTVRNWITFDQPVLLSTNDATVLTGANCHDTYHGKDLGSWRVDCRSHVSGAGQAFRHQRPRCRR